MGLACGDAVGTTVEFSPRGTFAAVTDMVGGGPFQLDRGEWTDDTSMALCLATSLVELQRFSPIDQMHRYCRWMNEGYLSCNGTCFDIGSTVEDALLLFQDTGHAYSGSTDARAAGNGCIMRLAPVPMFFYPDRNAVLEHSGLSARTTHGALECVEASRLFGAILFQALSGADKETILADHGLTVIASETIRLLARGDYRSKSEDAIRGTGYVVDSLEAALWCFAKTDSFEQAILCAANLGDDADTTAAICGQVAGAFYGASGISRTWLEALAWKDRIQTLADRLCD